MIVWIVNPFDPLPGDPEQEGRYATLARCLVARGHRVLWWTSSFSHRFKRAVDQHALTTACRRAGFEPRFLEAPAYQRNVGLARLRNHAHLAERFAEQAPREVDRPAVVVTSSPPLGLAWAAVRFAKAAGARSVIDVQDLWPDNFARLAPPALRPALRPAIWAMRRNVRRAARACDAIVGVADGYVNDSLREARGAKVSATIPLGVDLAAFDRAAAAGRAAEPGSAAAQGTFQKPPGDIWLAYTGSLNRNYDFLTTIRAVAALGGKLAPNVRFFLTSRGELASTAEKLIREHRLSNVAMTGFLDFEPWAHLLTQCDAGFNACFPEAFIFLPNKIFYYLAAGAAVLNTIPGQCSQIVSQGGLGLNYRAGDVESCAAAIMQIVTDEPARRRMRAAARRAAETEFDRAVIYPRYVALIEQLG